MRERDGCERGLIPAHAAETHETSRKMSEVNAGASGPEQSAGGNSPAKKRRRGRRGGKNRNRNRQPGAATTAAVTVELPDPPREGKMVSPQAASDALVRKPQIGDTRPAPVMAP
ncbi:MAG: hypothetical protein ACO22C_02645, partial [Ilumatobacteraceae bacterium]